MTSAAEPATPNPDVESIYTTVWIGSLLLAGNPGFDAFPDELTEIATEYFLLFAPVAKA